jgi:hypothetical protein
MDLTIFADVCSSVNPLMTLVEVVLPSYAEDSRDMVQRILQVADARGVPVDSQDGFDLYKEMAEIRRIHSDALPK